MKNILFFTILLFNFHSFSQNIIWQKSIGSENADYAKKIIETNDGGYAITGYKWVNDSITNNMYDFYIIKTDITGNIIWEKNYGGSSNDYANSIIQTNDGGFIVVGYAYSKDGDITNPIVPSETFCDIWVIKLSANGNLVWEKSFGSNGDEFAYDIIKTNDNNYLICGNDSKAYLLKINENGTEQWTNHYNTGISGYDAFKTIINTHDGNYLAAGYFSSNIGDFNGQNPWVIKLDTEGDTIWSNVYTGQNNEVINSVIELNDESFVFTGNSSSDILSGKISNLGEKIWFKTYFGFNNDEAYSICKSNIENNVIIAGYSESSSGIVNSNYGLSDYLLLELDSEGDTVWTKNFGGSYNDFAYSVIKSTDNKYIVCGSSNSIDYDVEDNIGNFDLWLLKLSNFVSVNETDNKYSIVGYPNPTNGNLYIETNFEFSKLIDINIFNMLGESIYSMKNKNISKIITIDFSSFSKGIYSIKIGNNDFTKTIKVIYE